MVVDAHRLVVMIITRTMMRICIITDMNLYMVLVVSLWCCNVLHAAKACTGASCKPVLLPRLASACGVQRARAHAAREAARFLRIRARAWESSRQVFASSTRVQLAF